MQLLVYHIASDRHGEGERLHKVIPLSISTEINSVESLYISRVEQRNIKMQYEAAKKVFFFVI